MDPTELVERVQAVRERTGKVTAAGLREQALDDLGAELANEQAGTLSRLGMRLDDAKRRLEAIDAGWDAPDADREALVAAHDRARKDLVDARWELTVVREAMGWRGGHRDLDLFWRIPPRRRAG
ncbi:MAG: hypothetical protein ABMB14_03225 [Myxococcota bacterium]